MWRARRKWHRSVTVSGGVGKAGLYPLSLRGDTLLDVIAGSGGASSAYETVVNITQAGEIASSYLDHVQETPADNIYLRPGDQISIEKMPRTYSAFGAVERKGNIEFGAGNLNLLEAVGKTSGLADVRADASGVFLFRFEKRAVAERFACRPVQAEGDLVPVIYRLNLKDPNQYFFAQAIAMQDRDVDLCGRCLDGGAAEVPGAPGLGVYAAGHCDEDGEFGEPAVIRGRTLSSAAERRIEAEVCWRGRHCPWRGHPGRGNRSSRPPASLTMHRPAATSQALICASK